MRKAFLSIAVLALLLLKVFLVSQHDPAPAPIGPGWAYVEQAYRFSNGDFSLHNRNAETLAHPGFSWAIWVVHQAGISLYSALEGLGTLAALLFFLALLGYGVPAGLALLALLVLVFHPGAFPDIESIHPNFFFFSLLLSAISLSLMALRARRGWGRVLLRALLFATLVIAWTSLANPWPILLILAVDLIGSLGWLPLADASWALPKTRSTIVLALLFPLVTVGVSKTSLRLWETFTAESTTRSLAEKKPKAYASHFLQPMVRTRPVEKNFIVSGWVVAEQDSVVKVQLVDRQDRVLAHSGAMQRRTDVHSVLRGEVREGVELDSGFSISCKKCRLVDGEWRLAAMLSNGSRQLLPQSGEKLAGFEWVVETAHSEKFVSGWVDEVAIPLAGFAQLWREVFLYAGLLGAFFLFLGLLNKIALPGVGILLFPFSLLLILALSLQQDQLANWIWLCMSVPVLWMAWSAFWAVAASPDRPFGFVWLFSWTPQRFALLLVPLGGLLLLFLNPPFQAPDEYSHLLRAYQVSEWGRKDEEVPMSIYDFRMRFDHVPFHPQNKVFPRQLADELGYRLNPEERQFQGKISTTGLVYLPQAMGVAIGRLLGLPPLMILYLGRIAGLLSWTLLLWATIRRTPVFPWVFLMLGLSPMALYLAGAFSHDTVTNGICFFTIATFMAYAWGKKSSLDVWDVLQMTALCSLATVAKSIYFFLALLFLWIPWRRFGSRLKYAASFLLIAGASLSVSYLWNRSTGTVAKLGEVSVGGVSRFGYILDDPWNFAQMVFRTYWNEAHLMFYSWIGQLGWLDTWLSPALRYFYFFSLIAVALFDHRSSIRIGWLPKLWSLAIFLCGLALVALALFWIWTPLGSPTILGIQGRYFIPFAILAFLPLYNRRIGFGLDRQGSFAWVPIALLIIFLGTAVAVINRFYYF